MLEKLPLGAIQSEAPFVVLRKLDSVAVSEHKKSAAAMLSLAQFIRDHPKEKASVYRKVRDGGELY